MTAEDPVRLSNLRRFIRKGKLRVRDADGKVHVFGGLPPGPDVGIHLVIAIFTPSCSSIRSCIRPKPIWTAR